MKRREYFEECSRLSNDFSQKLAAVDEVIAADPNLEEEGAYDKYWKLQNEASSAAIAWTNYCADNRDRIED